MVLMDINEKFDFNGLNNEELERKLQKEFMYYSEDLDELAHIIRKQLPRKMVYRIISKLYRLRGIKWQSTRLMSYVKKPKNLSRMVL